MKWDDRASGTERDAEDRKQMKRASKRDEERKRI